MSLRGKDVVAVSVDPGDAVELGDAGLLLSLSKEVAPSVGGRDFPFTG